MAINIRAEKAKNSAGYTLLELVVVIAIICILIVVALDRYNDLLVTVERNRMEYDLGVMRSAISMQVAEHFVAGDMKGLHELVGQNPMTLLTEKPSNYRGVREQGRHATGEKGIWFYQSSSQALIYLAKNTGSFRNTLVPGQARFKIAPVYSEKKQGDSTSEYISGLILQELEPYEWLQSSK